MALLNSGRIRYGSCRESSLVVIRVPRLGLGEMLCRTLNHQDKIAVYERYSRGEMDKDVARVLLGTAIDRMEEEKEAFETAMNRDTSSFLAEKGLLP